jgi:hypothetical protein
MILRRRFAIAGVLAVIVGVALGIALGEGDEDEPSRLSPAQTATESPATGERDTAEGGTEATPDRLTSRERAGIEQAVLVLVESVEQGDGSRLCDVLGQPPAGAGPEAVATCARAAGVSLAGLPTSDEVSIERVRASGSRARVRLAGGTVVSLERVRREWKVRRVSVGS